MHRFALLVACLLPAGAGSLAAVTPAAAPAPATPLTFERLFADPPLDGTLPHMLQWLPDGTRYSYVERSGEGKDAVTALVVTAAASGTATTLLTEKDLPSFSSADRQVRPRLAGYRWSPTGGSLLLSGDGELFLYTVEGGVVRRLTTTPEEEDEAQFSPDERFVAYVRGNDLYALELASGREERLTDNGGPARLNGTFDWLYREELAEYDTHAYAWSPDSRTIALISLDETGVPKFPLTDLLTPQPRTDEQFYPRPGDTNPSPSLRVVPVFAPGRTGGAKRDLRWSGDSTYLVRVGWTPGGQVWYELLDRAQTTLTLNLLDPATGLSSTLVSDHDAAWVNLNDDLYFMKDGRFVWSSEKDGYRHLYLHDASGKQVSRLTKGEWEVERLDLVDEATGTLWFSCNATKPVERQLYRVKLDGSAPVRVTQEPGAHRIDVAPGGRFVIDNWSRATRPRSIRLLDASGKAVRAIAANEHPPILDHPQPSVEIVTIPGPDGLPLYASLMKPAGFDPARRYPVIVYTYGGPHLQVVADEWGGRYTLFHQLLASRGFLVFALDNRGSYGRGRAFERATLRRFGKVELEDQLTGVEWLKKQPFVDGARLGIWGWSYGGYMTAYALTHAKDVFKAGVAVASVTDWRYYDSAYTERYLKLPADNPEGYRDSSPVTAAADLSGALLLAHGTGDDNVHWQNTLAMVDALYKAGKPYDLQLYANKSHGIEGRDARKHLHARILEHFERWLKP